MQFTGFLGVALFCFIGFLFSKNKKAIDWKLVIWGIVMQFIIAAIILGKGLISLVPFFIWVALSSPSTRTRQANALLS